MPNPKPDLQGWSDRASVPGWEERAIERVRARQVKTERARRRRNGLYLFFDDPFRTYLDEACARRNISLTGYLRRAAAAMIAHDLKLPFEEVAQHAARPMPYGKHGGTFKKIKSQDDGKDFGYWIIAKLLRHEPTTEE